MWVQHFHSFICTDLKTLVSWKYHQSCCSTRRGGEDATFDCWDTSQVSIRVRRCYRKRKHLRNETLTIRSLRTNPCPSISPCLQHHSAFIVYESYTLHVIKNTFYVFLPSYLGRPPIPPCDRRVSISPLIPAPSTDNVMICFHYRSPTHSLCLTFPDAPLTHHYCIIWCALSTKLLHQIVSCSRFQTVAFRNVNIIHLFVVVDISAPSQVG